MDELEKDLEELMKDENNKKKNVNINIIDEKEDILLDDNSVEIKKKYVKKICVSPLNLLVSSIIL